MELRVIRYYLEIAERGSFRAAAEHLHIAQPSLSRQIRSLETELGFALFSREGRSARLTAAGTAFLPAARALRDEAVRAHAAAGAIASGDGVRLSVAAATTTVTDIVGPFIAAQGRDGAVVDALPSPPGEIYGLVAERVVDVGVGALPPPAHLAYRRVGAAHILAQLAHEHPLVGRAAVEIEDLIAHDLAVPTREHMVRRILDQAVADAGLAFTPRHEVEVPQLAQALAAAGRAVAVLSDDLAYGLEGLPIAAHGGDLAFALYGVWDPAHFGAATIEAMLDDLERFILDRYPRTRGLGQGS